MADLNEMMFMSPNADKKSLRKIPSMFVWEDPKAHNKIEILEFVLGLLKHTECRDKFTKMLQYFCLTSSGILELIGHKSGVKAFNGLYSRFFIR